MARQIIATKYIGPTNTKSARVTARTSEGKSLVLTWDNAISAEGNHRYAARQLALKLEWHGAWHMGCIKGGYIFVLEDNDGFAL